MLHFPKDHARTTLVVVDLFAALTALGGGAMLATGLEDARFPAAWLAGTPFGSYVIPGVILAGAVGGSAAVAALATLRDRRTGGLASTLAGGVLAGWIVGEVVLLSGNRGEWVSPMEGLYLLASLAMGGLGILVRRRSGARDPRDPIPGRV
jgi:hypothetical protein